MNKSSINSVLAICFLMVFLLISCKEKDKTPETIVAPIDQVFKDYYDFKKGANPIEATKAGFDDYNDTIANYISDNYQETLKERYTRFLNQLDAYDE